MQDARIALVPDLLGGFKLKGLDYVFNRLPILAMRIALPGMPLEEGRSVGLFDSHSALAEGVVALIDDFRASMRGRKRAYAACADRFDWGGSVAISWRTCASRPAGRSERDSRSDIRRSVSAGSSGGRKMKL